MRPIVTFVLLCQVLAYPVEASSDFEEPRLEQLFPRQAMISAETDSMTRLVLPPDVLAACRPDLSDLRIVDAEGRPVPYIVDSGRPPHEQVEVVETDIPRILSVDRRTHEREDRPDIQRERYEISLPSEEPTGRVWDLVVSAPGSRYVRRIRVSGEAAGGVPVVLAEASIFRLRRPAALRDRVGLSTLVGDRLVIEIEGEEGFFLEPTFRYERRRMIEAGQLARIDLTLVDRRDAGGRTEFEFLRPLGVVPDVLEFGTTTRAFRRPFVVWDAGRGSRPVKVGEGVLFRFAGAVDVEQLDLEVSGARGDRLIVVVRDGDSPALEELGVQAVVRQPALIFSLPPALGPGRLLFGGGRAHRPRYDLAEMRPALPVVGEAAELAERMYDPGRLPVARLGERRANPAFDPRPALEFAMRPGSALDERFYTHRVPFAARPSAEGLVRIELDLETLAVARRDLADLRVVDASGRQWAYLVGSDRARVTSRLGVGAPTTDKGASTYRLEVPVAQIAAPDLVVHSPVDFFDREFTVTGQLADTGEERILRQGRLTRLLGDPEALRIDLGEERITSLEITLADGDDAVLELTRVDASFSVPEIYLVAPAGEYSLLVGRPTAVPPSYELARIREYILAVPAATARLGGLSPNPDYSVRARLSSGQGLQTGLLWSAILVVVGVLVWMTLRLARQPPPPT